MSKITLENMEFHAFHGCLDHEKEYGNTYLISLGYEADTTLAEKTDNLNDTINYKEIYDTVKKEMEKPSRLIENIASRIVESVLESFSQIKSVEIKLSKIQPPVGGKVQNVSIELRKAR